MPVLRFDPQVKQALLTLQADANRRALFLAVKNMLLHLRDDEGDPPRARALQTIGGGHGYYVPVSAGDEHWAIGWKRLEDGTRGILYIGPDLL